MGRSPVTQSMLPIGWVIEVSTAANGERRKKYVHMLSGTRAVSLPDIIAKNKSVTFEELKEFALKYSSNLRKRWKRTRSKCRYEEITLKWRSET